jgi:hypothetical protein
MTTPAADAPARRWSTGRIVVTVLVAAMVAMWGYVMYLSFGPGRQAPPDRLGDPAFAEAAQARCDEALDEVATLPRAVDVATSAERAEVVDAANRSFGAMLDDLEALTPAGEDGELVAEWLVDWRTYLGDREAYVEALRDDPEARLLISPKGNRQITEAIDGFAADNAMIACATPIDV